MQGINRYEVPAKQESTYVPLPVELLAGLGEGLQKRRAEIQDQQDQLSEYIQGLYKQVRPEDQHNVIKYGDAINSELDKLTSGYMSDRDAFNYLQGIKGLQRKMKRDVVNTDDFIGKAIYNKGEYDKYMKEIEQLKKEGTYQNWNDSFYNVAGDGIYKGADVNGLTTYEGTFKGLNLIESAQKAMGDIKLDGWTTTDDGRLTHDIFWTKTRHEWEGVTAKKLEDLAKVKASAWLGTAEGSEYLRKLAYEGVDVANMSDEAKADVAAKFLIRANLQKVGGVTKDIITDTPLSEWSHKMLTQRDVGGGIVNSVTKNPHLAVDEDADLSKVGYHPGNYKIYSNDEINKASSDDEKARMKNQNYNITNIMQMYKNAHGGNEPTLADIAKGEKSHLSRSVLTSMPGGTLIAPYINMFDKYLNKDSDKFALHKAQNARIAAGKSVDFTNEEKNQVAIQWYNGILQQKQQNYQSDYILDGGNQKSINDTWLHGTGKGITPFATGRSIQLYDMNGTNIAGTQANEKDKQNSTVIGSLTTAANAQIQGYTLLNPNAELIGGYVGNINSQNIDANGNLTKDYSDKMFRASADNEANKNQVRSLQPLMDVLYKGVPQATSTMQVVGGGALDITFANEIKNGQIVTKAYVHEHKSKGDNSPTAYFNANGQIIVGADGKSVTKQQGTEMLPQDAIKLALRATGSYPGLK